MIYWWEKAFLLVEKNDDDGAERRRNLNGDDTWISKKFELHLPRKAPSKKDRKKVSWESRAMWLKLS